MHARKTHYHCIATDHYELCDPEIFCKHRFASPKSSILYISLQRSKNISQSMLLQLSRPIIWPHPSLPIVAG